MVAGDASFSHPGVHIVGAKVLHDCHHAIANVEKLENGTKHRSLF
jgi:hypothetical protein